MISPPSAIDYTKIDANMRLAVELLNNVPHMRTVECCGGHNGRNYYLNPPYTWFAIVEFQADTDGWAGLIDMRLICEAVGIHIKINPIAFKYHPEYEEAQACISFTVYGDYAGLHRLEKYLTEASNDDAV